MRKKLGIFTCYEKFHNSVVFDEFVEKNISFLNMLDYDIVYLSTTGDMKYIETVKKHIPNVEVRHLQLGSFIFEYTMQKNTRVPIITKYIDDIDVIYTYGNFISFNINKSNNKHDLTQRDLMKIGGSYDDNALYYAVYIAMKEALSIAIIASQLQFMSDPLDLVYPHMKQLTPDMKNNTKMEYLPIYQYYHLHQVKKVKSEKTINFIAGSTLFDGYRRKLYCEYLLPLESKFQTIYKCGWTDRNMGIHDNMIPHDEFFEQIGKSICGLVLNTYAENIISANKLFAFLAQDCVPIITKDADKISQYIPTYLKVEVSDVFELYGTITKMNEMGGYYISEYKKYFSMEFDKEQIESYIKRMI